MICLINNLKTHTRVGRDRNRKFFERWKDSYEETDTLRLIEVEGRLVMRQLKGGTLVPSRIPESFPQRKSTFTTLKNTIFLFEENSVFGFCTAPIYFNQFARMASSTNHPCTSDSYTISYKWEAN